MLACHVSNDGHGVSVIYTTRGPSTRDTTCWHATSAETGMASVMTGYGVVGHLRPTRMHLRQSSFPASFPRRVVLLPAFIYLSSLAADNVNAARIPMTIEPDLPKFRRTSSGLKIQEVSEGTGPEAREGQIVEFNYVCRRSNGYYVYSTMDSSNRDSQPVTISLGAGKMISGLDEVIKGMKAGGKRRVLIPPELGYVTEDLEPQPEEFGPRRSLMSHSKEPLVFEVQLMKIK